MKISKALVALALMSVPTLMAAEVVNVGSGSYSTTFPGKDSADRNGYPTGSPLVSGNAAGRPVPSNDWWSAKLTEAQPKNLFNYPLALKTLPEGLVVVRNMEGQAVAGDNPVTIGVEGITDATPTVSDYTDWTVTFAWRGDAGAMEAIAGNGMPMVYMTKTCDAAVTVKVGLGNAEVYGNMIVVTGSYNNGAYAIYAPEGSTWTRSDNTFSSTLGGKRYWTVALLPHNTTNPAATAEDWKEYAFSFPADTRATWDYDTSTGVVTTTYTVTPDIKEGDGPVLMGLLPHQWGNLNQSVTLEHGTYDTVRGTLRLLAANSFTTTLSFHGVLPTVAPVTQATTGYDEAEQRRLIDEVIAGDGLSDWTDSYNDGQLLNRLVQTARIAEQIGYTDAFDTIYGRVKARLENWLTYSQGEIAFMFYYYEPWGALLGYPAGHGQDTNLNDHHFHWGYFIGAAAFIAQHDTTWARNWGEMVNMLVRDAASTDREDPMFPYLRSFSPYAGHCWANGTASISTGNDQESTSESMQFHSSLLNWAEATGNTTLRDLAVYMYVTELSATEEYWFDIHDRVLPEGYGYHIVSRVFTNAYDTSNFWGAGTDGSYGIHIYPVHAGSFYLVHDPAWAATFWEAMTRDTGVLDKVRSDNLWYDSYWQFLAMIDAQKALELYNDFQDRPYKFGTSGALTYYWLHSMAQTGRPNQCITATSPMAAAFDNGGTTTYAVQNYGTTAREVTFSNGFTMTALPGKLTVATAPTVEATDPAAEHVEPTVKAEPGKTPDVTDPDKPDNPDQPTDPTDWTTTVDNESTDGAGFKGDYTVKYRTTDKNTVEISVTFDGTYEGSVAYLWNQTSGFAETAMSASGNNTFTGSIANVKAGDTVKFRIKLAYAGGMGVTREIVYTVGDTGGGNPEEPDEPVTPVDPDTVNAAPTPTHSSEVVRSFFSDSYPTIAPSLIVGSWGQATQAEKVILGDSNNAYRLTNFNYLGLQVSGANDVVDITGATHIHVDLYATHAMTVDFHLISLNETIDGDKATLSVAAGEWISFDVPISTHYPTVNLDRVGQFKFVNVTPAASAAPARAASSDPALYVDNIYAWTQGGTTGVENVTFDTTTGNVYDLYGRLIRRGTSTLGLPTGIYVVGGRKVMVRAR